MENEGIGIGEAISFLRHLANLTRDQRACVEVLVRAYEEALKNDNKQGEKTHEKDEHASRFGISPNQ